MIDPKIVSSIKTAIASLENAAHNLSYNKDDEAKLKFTLLESAHTIEAELSKATKV